MLNDQVSRIINSTVCDTIASTVSKNHEQLQQLEGALAERSQQIMMLHQRIGEEIKFFEEMCERNRRWKEQAERFSTVGRDFRKVLGGFRQVVGGEVDRGIREIQNYVVEETKEIIRKVLEYKQAEFESIKNQELEKQNQEIKRLGSLLQLKEDQINQQSIKIEQLLRINNQLKKQQLSKIFSKKQSKTSFTIPQNSRQRTAQSDILRTLDHHDNTQNTFTQPNLQQTAIMGDFSRKRSLIVSPSCTTISVFHVFDFERLIQVSYEGKRLAGKKSATGTAMYQGRFIYEGEFVRDLREGHGVLRQNKDVVYMGNWKGGVFHGKGTLNIFPNTVKYKNWKSYTGHFNEGNIEGIGTVTFINGQSLLSNYKSGSPVSKGILFGTQDSSIYYGQYRNQTFTSIL